MEVDDEMQGDDEGQDEGDEPCLMQSQLHATRPRACPSEVTLAFAVQSFLREIAARVTKLPSMLRFVDASASMTTRTSVLRCSPGPCDLDC